jgi:hypothetical protein
VELLPVATGFQTVSGIRLYNRLTKATVQGDNLATIFVESNPNLVADFE